MKYSACLVGPSQMHQLIREAPKKVRKLRPLMPCLRNQPQNSKILAPCTRTNPHRSLVITVIFSEPLQQNLQSTSRNHYGALGALLETLAEPLQ